MLYLTVSISSVSMIALQMVLTFCTLVEICILVESYGLGDAPFIISHPGAFNLKKNCTNK